MGVTCHHDTPHGMAKATVMGFPVCSVHGENKRGIKIGLTIQEPRGEFGDSVYCYQLLETRPGLKTYLKGTVSL